MRVRNEPTKCSRPFVVSLSNHGIPFMVSPSNHGIPFVVSVPLSIIPFVVSLSNHNGNRSVIIQKTRSQNT
jgi:heme/copper-type cytochrome/quinol oxidase subunit 4